MPGYYSTIVTQLVTDIRSVIGGTATVLFGNPRRELEPPYAVVRTRLSRNPARDRGGPRKREEAYTFEIELRVAVPAIEPEYGHEVYMMGLAASLTDLLDPYDVAVVPSPRSQYAGVCTSVYVTDIASVDTEDSDDHLAIRLTVDASTFVNS